MLIKKHILSIIFFIIICSNAFGGETIYLTSGEWPPFISENLNQQGVFSHIIKESYANVGIKVEYRFYPWIRSYKLAKSGKFDGSITWAPTKERKKDFYFTDPLFFNKKVFFHLKKKSFYWQSIDDLKDLRIGATSQYTYGEEFDQAVRDGKINVDYVSHDRLNIKKLLKGRFDVFPMEIEVGYSLIHSELTPENAAMITHHPKPVQLTPMCVAISKQIEPKRAKLFIESFNNGLDQLKKSKKYDEMILKFRQGKYNKGN